MIQKKICMVGAFAVGKTSLIRRYVHSLFSDKYHTTVGVKIDKKDITLGDKAVRLMLWDLAGKDDFCDVPTSYLRGAAGYLLVADGTRAHTIDTAEQLKRKIESEMGRIPCVFLLNKVDREAEWEINPSTIARLGETGMPILKTSAKDAIGVEGAFERIGSLTTDPDQ
jgi:small GTP-binding protein